jgi:hypothetical protein
MTGRHDARYYLPRFTRLEDRVAARATGKLRDYSRQSAGGATPKAEEKEKYYSDDPETGIPFIRVQNLSVSGALSLDDVKLINRETHNGMLARSHVGPDDLLTKITGVGRMAVSSVPPPGFEGNINQHLVRIKTKDRHTSEVLAAYLNTDIAEQLATRRATGGTRPALDYPALRSIPIIFDERILPIASAARDRRKQRLEEASALLASIDDYLLSELGIVLPPETENTLANRTFRVSAHELGGWRFDPYHHQTCFHKFDDALQGGKHPLSSLRNAYRALVNGYDCRDFVEDGLPYLKVAQVKPFNLKIEDAQAIPVSGVPARGLALMGDLLLTRKGTYGDAALNRSDTPFAFSSEVFRIRLNPSKLNGDYAEAVLNSVLVRTQFKRHSIGAIMGSLSQSIFGKIQIPLPPIDEQQRIAEYCQIIRGHAKVLEAKAITELESAKREIEAILLDSPKQLHQPRNSFALG